MVMAVLQHVQLNSHTIVPLLYLNNHLIALNVRQIVDFAQVLQLLNAHCVCMVGMRDLLEILIAMK